MYPTELISIAWPMEIENRGLVGFEKSKFFNLLHKSILHVPTKAASFTTFHLSLAGGLHYRDTTTGKFHGTLSKDGRKLYTTNQENKKKLAKVCGKNSAKHNRSERDELNSLPEYVSVEFGLCSLTRLWDLEDDYKQTHIAEHCIHFIQYWCRVHQKRKAVRMRAEIMEKDRMRRATERNEHELRRLALLKHEQEEREKKMNFVRSEAWRGAKRRVLSIISSLLLNSSLRSSLCRSACRYCAYI